MKDLIIDCFAGGGGRKGTGRQWRRDAERDECGGVPGDGEGG